jgi:hypothetical protein
MVEGITLSLGLNSDHKVYSSLIRSFKFAIIC